MSGKTKTIVTILLLLLTFVSPIFGLIGVVIMWFWTKWPTWVKIIITIPFALISISILLATSYLFVWRPFKMAGDTMFPTLRNEEYLVTRIINKSTEIKQADIVIFQSPVDPNKAIIKRVIGLPEEKIMIHSGYVYINGQKLDEASYLPSEVTTSGGPFMKEDEEKTIPQDEYFVLGDNRSTISDSREWGFIKKSNIISKYWFCYWNCSK